MLDLPVSFGLVFRGELQVPDRDAVNDSLWVALDGQGDSEVHIPLLIGGPIHNDTLGAHIDVLFEIRFDLS